jgi:phosphoglycolate phosphatase-like HAD superfamily hydrolase
MAGSHEESDYERLAASGRSTEFVPGTSIELLHPIKPGLRPEHALFDFDGTLSLIREGWMKVMVPMMVEILQSTPAGGPPQELQTIVRDFVTELTGKQTIYQMIRLAEEVAQRGGTPDEPLVYKRLYHDRLMERIAARREDLRSGRTPPAEMVVPGSFELLAALRERGVRLYLASGTDEVYVREEAELLGIDQFFGEHIYGAVDDYRSFSKALVIQRILKIADTPADKLFGFGDGYFEIQNVKEAGGTAVGVASDEARRSGRPDAWKRDRLLGVGADVIVPDFREHDQLITLLWSTATS